MFAVFYYTLVPDFMEKNNFLVDVYSVVTSIPKGKVMTYGQIAYLVGRPQNSRLVGCALRGVSAELHLPCHRVVNCQGRIAPGWPEQRKLLEEEGVLFKKNGCVNMKVYQWEFMNE